MYIQLQKLGIIPFDEQLSGAILSTYKMIWANNGDCISRQYTGTAAMKVNTEYLTLSTCKVMTPIHCVYRET